MLRKIVVFLFAVKFVFAGYMGDPKSYEQGTSVINMIEYLETKQSEYNYSDWDLLPNSISNWSNIIQDAIDELPASGGCLYFPSGIYKINQDIKISCDGDNQNKPIHIIGTSYANTVNDAKDGSTIQRIGSGNVIRINLNDSNYGEYNKVYNGFSASNITFAGDGNNNITAIKGYRTRLSLHNVVISRCKNGIEFNSLGNFDSDGDEIVEANVVDYSDVSSIINLRIIKTIENGVCINIRGADATTLSGIYIEGGAPAVGIQLIASQGTNINNVLINNANTAIKLSFCNAISITGWHSESVNRGFDGDGVSGVNISGFIFSQKTTMEHVFHFDNSSRNNIIQNGVINVPLDNNGYDLYTQFSTVPIFFPEFNNVVCKTYDGENVIIRAPKFAGFGGGVPAKLGSSTLELNGQNFIQLLDNNGNKPFTVGSTGNLTTNGTITAGNISTNGTITAGNILFPDGTSMSSITSIQPQSYTIHINNVTESGWINSVYTDHNCTGNTVSIWGAQIVERLPKVGDWIIINSKPYMVVCDGNNTQISVPENEDATVVALLRNSISNSNPLTVIRYSN